MGTRKRPADIILATLSFKPRQLVRSGHHFISNNIVDVRIDRSNLNKQISLTSQEDFHPEHERSFLCIYYRLHQDGRGKVEDTRCL